MLREGFYSDNFKVNSISSYSFAGSGSESHNRLTDTIDVVTGNAIQEQMTYTNSALPNSGYLRIKFNLVKNYPTDFLVYVRVQEDSSNYYEFRIEGDNTVSEYIRKYVGGVETDASSMTTGSITGTPNSPPVGGEDCNIDVIIECFWAYDFMKFISTIDDITTNYLELNITGDTSELDISNLIFPWYQGDVKVESLQVKYFYPRIDKEGNAMSYNFSEIELLPIDNPSYSPEMRLARYGWYISGEFREQL